MAAHNDNILDLERQRSQLEKNVADLRKSLKYWQTWEAEYEGLKEEIEGLGINPKSKALVKVCDDFGGEFLTESEIRSLTLDRKGELRTASQILGPLSRRIDYVQQNVKTVKKRLEVAEDKLSAVDVVINPEPRNEEGLQLTEIAEELDDDDNVLSSSITRPGETTSQIVDTLRKVGGKEILDPNQRSDEVIQDVNDPSSTKTAVAKTAAVPPEIIKHYSPESLAAELQGNPKQDTKGNTTTSSSAVSQQEFVENSVPQSTLFNPQDSPKSLKKKRVSFAPDTKDDSPASSKAYVPARLKPTRSSNNLLTSNNLLKPSIISNLGQSRTKLVQLLREAEDSNEIQKPVIPQLVQLLRKAEDSYGIQEPVIPLDESPEDAAMRHQMLQYNLNEVGAIVAEMDFDLSDSSNDAEFGSDTDEDEDEDEFGRTSKPVLDDDYRSQMLELERKLNAKVLQNVGPNPDLPTLGTIIDKEIVATDDTPKHSSKTSRTQDSKKKNVQFASKLDVSEALKPDSQSSENDSRKNDARPISDLVLEKEPSTQPSAAHTATPRKPSKLKSSLSKRKHHGDAPAQTAQLATKPNKHDPASIHHKNNIPEPAPFPPWIRPNLDGPLKRTHADIVERLSPKTQQQVTEPDEYDPALIQQQVAIEYHRMRNRMIQRSGGFMREEDEPAEVDVAEEGDGGRRVSRFKAARLARDQPQS